MPTLGPLRQSEVPLRFSLPFATGFASLYGAGPGGPSHAGAAKRSFMTSAIACANGGIFGSEPLQNERSDFRDKARQSVPEPESRPFLDMAAEIADSALDNPVARLDLLAPKALFCILLVRMASPLRRIYPKGFERVPSSRRMSSVVLGTLNNTPTLSYLNIVSREDIAAL